MDAFFTSEQVMRITGVTKRKLQYWLGNGVVHSDIAVAKGRGTVRLFSFQNLVELRVALRVREQISLQSLRKTIDRLRALDPSRVKALAELRFGVYETKRGVEVMVKNADGTWEHGISGQILFEIPVPIRDLSKEMSKKVKADQRATRQVGATQRRRGALGSKELFAGTRIPVSSVIRMSEAGKSIAQIRASYPQLESSEIRKAIRRAS